METEIDKEAFIVEIRKRDEFILVIANITVPRIFTVRNRIPFQSFLQEESPYLRTFVSPWVLIAKILI